MNNNTAKQKRFRDRQKERGMVEVKTFVSQDELDLLRQCYDDACHPGNSFKEFLRKVLVRGAVFVCNSGAGHRLKKTTTGYSLTRGKEL